MLDRIWISQNYIVALNLIYNLYLHSFSRARLDLDLPKTISRLQISYIFAFALWCMLDWIWISQNYIVALNLIFILHCLSPARLDFNLSKLYHGFKSHIFVWVCTFCCTLDRRPDSRRARVHPGSREMGTWQKSTSCWRCSSARRGN